MHFEKMEIWQSFKKDIFLIRKMSFFIDINLL